MTDYALHRFLEIESILLVIDSSLPKVGSIKYFHDGTHAFPHVGQSARRHLLYLIRNSAHIPFHNGRKPRLTLRQIPLHLMTDEVQKIFLLLIYYLQLPRKLLDLFPCSDLVSDTSD